ncbi:MAG: hypothetical protein WCO56_08760 [Verrucomicrobiota bacterium]
MEIEKIGGIYCRKMNGQKNIFNYYFMRGSLQKNGRPSVFHHLWQSIFVLHFSAKSGWFIALQ